MACPDGYVWSGLIGGCAPVGGIPKEQQATYQPPAPLAPIQPIFNPSIPVVTYTPTTQVVSNRGYTQEDLAGTNAVINAEGEIMDADTGEILKQPPVQESLDVLRERAFSDTEQGLNPSYQTHIFIDKTSAFDEFIASSSWFDPFNLTGARDRVNEQGGDFTSSFADGTPSDNRKLLNDLGFSDSQIDEATDVLEKGGVDGSGTTNFYFTTGGSSADLNEPPSPPPGILDLGGLFAGAGSILLLLVVIWLAKR